MTLEIAKVTAVSLGLLYYGGWGIALLLLPTRLHRRSAYLLMPVFGLAIVDSIGHSMSFLGLASRHSMLILLLLTSGLNIVAVFYRRERLRLPSQREVAIILLALPALLLAIWPILTADQLSPIGTGNGDPVAHATATEFLTNNSYRDEIPGSLEYAIFSSTSDKMDRFVRLGFHYYQSYVDLLSSESAYATYSIISGVGMYLWALTIGFFTSAVLGQSKRIAYLATLLFAISALPLWTTYGGYGPQSLGMGLLVSSFGLWVLALEERDWLHLMSAAVVSAGLVGIYSEAVVYLVLSIAVYAAIMIAFNSSERWQIIKAGVMIMGLSILMNAIGWGRAVLRMVDLRPRIVYGSTGNVDWFIDPRQISGFIPFGRNVTQWYSATISTILWMPIVLVGATIIYGFIRLATRPRRIVISFLLPNLATILWFTLRAEPYPYGYFKAWSMGWWVYVILLAVGLIAFATLLARHRRTSYAAILVIPLASLLLLASIKLSLEMRNHIPLNSMIFETIEWVEDIDPEGRLYVATGDLNGLSTFWLSHLLRDRPTRFSEGLLYSDWPGTPYHGENFVLRHISSKDDWVEELLTESIIRENQEFALLTLEPQGGREFDLPDPDNPLDILVGEQFRLLGYDTDLELATNELEPAVTLYWQAISGTDANFKVFVHILDEQGQLVGQYDGQPRDWTYFTYLWQSGEVVEDAYRLTLIEELRPGNYELHAGLYDPDTGERLPVVQNGQPMANSAAFLGNFVIYSIENPG